MQRANSFPLLLRFTSTSANAILFIISHVLVALHSTSFSLCSCSLSNGVSKPHRIGWTNYNVLWSARQWYEQCSYGALSHYYCC